MNYRKMKKEFLNYVSSFDASNEKITRKITHSIRVGELGSVFGKLLKLNKEETQLLKVIGLLHDIGRFKQVSQYDTFYDNLSIDHGDLGVEILFEQNLIRKFIKTDKYDDIIYHAIKNHNKFNIEGDLDSNTLKYVKLIRDMDKIDIFRLLDNDKLEKTIKKELLQKFYSKELIDWKLVTNKDEETLGHLSFVFDLDFKESIELLNKKKIFTNYLKSIDVSAENKEEYKKIKEFIARETGLIV